MRCSMLNLISKIICSRDTATVLRQSVGSRSDVDRTQLQA